MTECADDRFRGGTSVPQPSSESLSAPMSVGNDGSAHDGPPGSASASVPDAEKAAHSAAVMRWRQQSEARNLQREDEIAQRSKSAHKRPWWIEIPIMLAIAFLATFLIQTFVARVYYVPSGSMEPTLHGVSSGGDRILAYKLGYTFGSPSQGDVVVFRGPTSWVPEAAFARSDSWWATLTERLGTVVGIAPPNEKDFVKRVIAVGGQTVSCCDEEGRVQVDGVTLDEPYILIDSPLQQWEWIDGVSNCEVTSDDPARYNSYRCFGPYTVPDGFIWVMGDHRSDSQDSTANCRGLVPSPDVQCQGPVPVSDVIGRAVAIVMPPGRWGGIGSPDIMGNK